VRRKREAELQRWRQWHTDALADAGRGQIHDSPEPPRKDSPATRDHQQAMPAAGPERASGRHWTAPGILEALIPGRMQSHACTAEIPR
jgi:hypothetical protein